MSVLSGGISMKLGTNSHYVSGHCWNGSQGHGSKVKVMQRPLWKSCELDGSWTADGIWTKTYPVFAIVRRGTDEVVKMMGSKVKVTEPFAGGGIRIEGSKIILLVLISFGGLYRLTFHHLAWRFDYHNYVKWFVRVDVAETNETSCVASLTSYFMWCELTD